MSDASDTGAVAIRSWSGDDFFAMTSASMHGGYQCRAPPRRGAKRVVRRCLFPGRYGAGVPVTGGAHELGSRTASTTWRTASITSSGC